MIFLKALTAVRAYFFTTKPTYFRFCWRQQIRSNPHNDWLFFNKKTHPGALWSLNLEAWMGTGTFIISRCAKGDLEIINADRVYFSRIGFDFYKEHAANHCAKSILCVNRTTNGNAIIITNDLLYIEFSRGR